MISFPLRLDSSGGVITVDDYSARAAAEIAGHVIACRRGERPLAPSYGLPDPSVIGIDASVVAGAIASCEPEVRALQVSIDPASSDRSRVQVDVEWSQS